MTWVSCWNPWPCLTSCTSASSDQHSGKHDKWSPLLGSVLSLECDVLCSCHMGYHVIVVSSSSVLCQWPWFLGPLMTCCQLWLCVSAHSQHLGSGCLDLHGQQFPNEVCITKSMHHLKLYVSFLLCICGKVASVSQSLDSFNKLIWCFTSFDPDLFLLIDPASLRYGVIYGAMQKVHKQFWHSFCSSLIPLQLHQRGSTAHAFFI